MNAQIGVDDENAIDLQLLQRQIDLAKTKARWNSCRHYMSPLVHMLTAQGLDVNFDNHLNITFTGDKPKFLEVLSALTICGFTLDNKERPKSDDTSWSSYCTHKAGSTQAWMYFTSSVCRRIKVGTETVTRDVFKVACDPMFETALPPPMIDHDLF